MSESPLHAVLQGGHHAALRKMFEQYGRQGQADAGSTLFARGSRGESMYMLLDGRVELLFKGGKEPKRLEAGEVFGELAFVIGDHERSATALAITPVRYWELNQHGFESLSAQMPDALFALLRNTCRYLLTSEQTLIEGLEARRDELELAMDFLRRTREELGLTVTTQDTDPLTGLYNMRCLQNRIIDLFDTPHGQGTGILLMRLEGVAAVNTALGHDYGDMVLNHFASSLRDCVGMKVFPSRLGGSLFALLLGHMSAEEAQQQALQLMAALGRRELDLPGYDLALSLTVVGDLRQGDESGGALLERLQTRLNGIEVSPLGHPLLCWAGAACDGASD